MNTHNYLASVLLGITATLANAAEPTLLTGNAFRQALDSTTDVVWKERTLREALDRLGEAKVLDREQHPRVLRIKPVVARFRPRRQRHQQHRQRHGSGGDGARQREDQAAMEWWRIHRRADVPGRSTDHSACAGVIAR